MAGSRTDKTIDDALRQLQSDRLIKLTIGAPENPPVFVQQSVLESASEWFARALKEDRFVEGTSGSISFPDDDIEAWTILLFWLINHRLPAEIEWCAAEKDCVTAGRCWVLGDKYGVLEFQDAAMLAMLKYFDDHNHPFSPEATAKLVIIAPPDSHLLGLLAEEAAYNVDHLSIPLGKLAVLDGMHGF